MKIIVESERCIGYDPFDFLMKHIIPDGSFVSIGYLKDSEINTGPRGKNYITPKNDAELTDMINKMKDDIFKSSLIKFQQSKAYQDALAGKRLTAPYDLEGCHLVKISRHLVNWKSPKALAKFYGTRAEAIGDTRVKHGFGDFPEEYDEDDWRHEYGGTGRYERSKSVGRQHLKKDDKPKYDNVYLRQVYNFEATKKAKLEDFWLFIDTNDNYYPLNKQSLEWFAKAFKQPKIPKAIRQIEQEEQAFLNDLNQIGNLDKTECKLILDNILYLTGTTVDKNKKKEPFIWLNDKVIAKQFPYLSQKKWETIIRKCIHKSAKRIAKIHENMKVILKKSYFKKLNENKTIRRRVKSYKRFKK